jgi:ElaB/YqjD/DUF883 family membrane-anchored ribosome-binding protein
MSIAFIHPLKGEQKKIATKIAAAQSRYAAAQTVDGAIIYLDDVWTVTGTRRDAAVAMAMNDIARVIKEVESKLAQSGEDATPDFTLLRKVLSALRTAQKGEDGYSRAIAERTSESAAMTELQRANIAAKVIGMELHARAEALKAAAKQG